MENREIIKQLESLIETLKQSETKTKVDFSILNDEDIFYMNVCIDPEDNYEYLFIGKDPFSKDVPFLNLEDNRVDTWNICAEENVKELRKATPEEIALYMQYYPTKQKIWIEVYKSDKGRIGAVCCNTKEDLEQALSETNRNGHTTLEVIEREY